MVYRILLVLLALCSFGSVHARLDHASTTYVTALYDLGRGNLKRQGRSFEYYLDNFKYVLATTANLVVYGEDSLREFVFTHRNQSNTLFIEYGREKIMEYWFADLDKKVMDRMAAGEDKAKAYWIKGLLIYRLPLYVQLMHCKMAWLAEV